MNVDTSQKDLLRAASLLASDVLSTDMEIGLLSR
jgi:hypothetical protein